MYRFYQDIKGSVWFHPQFLKDSSPEKMMITSKSNDRCCNNMTGQLWHCSSCYNAWYCSKDCQKYDWESHMMVCGEKLSSNFKKNNVNTEEASQSKDTNKQYKHGKVDR